MRLFTIISGIMLIMTSLFCYANPGETFLPLAFVLGCVMIITGIIQCVSYWWGREGRKDNNGWIFAEALITLILGILVITGLIAADAAIPMVFGMWVMFSGILRFVVATMINPSSKRANFIWAMLTGIIGTLSGLYAFLNPYIANLSIAVLLGFLFMIQGICTLELGIHMPHEKKEKKAKPKAKAIKIQIKKPVSKKKAPLDIMDIIPPVNIDADNIGETDIEKFKTEEIQLDDIRKALEFNFGAEEEPANEQEEMVEPIAEEISEEIHEEPAVSEEPAEEEFSLPEISGFSEEMIDTENEEK